MTGGAELSQETRGSMPRVDVVSVSLLGFALLAAGSWMYILLSGDSGASDLFRLGTWRAAREFVSELLGIGADGTPAYLDAGSWSRAIGLSIDTLAMSVLATGIAGVAALVTFMPAARTVAFGELSGSRSPWRAVAFFAVRVSYAVTRGVPDLVWAMLILFVFSPGILPGALALAFHNFGIIGKLSAEVVENLDYRPARALRVAGASNAQMLMYGVIPQVLPQFLTYLLYRWEVIIRTTLVVGFVGAGGLGLEFRLRMSYLHYDEVALLLLCYLVLVLGVDLASAGLRRLAR